MQIYSLSENQYAFKKTKALVIMTGLQGGSLREPHRLCLFIGCNLATGLSMVILSI
jgi:hypothetical protein